ncbi:hypothetical protein ILUMI_06938, partial [Ignelater luminosus]
WQTTIKVIMFLWHNMKEIDGFNYLSLRDLNQDSLENLFCSIRFHGMANTNPSCHQFTAALKTVVINKSALPPGSNGNCEEDTCSSLDDLCPSLKYVFDDHDIEVREDPQSAAFTEFKTLKLENTTCEDSQGFAYVAGYVLKSINVPDCEACQNRHLLITFKDMDSDQKLIYASDSVMKLVQNIHNNLYIFLEEHGFELQLERKFKLLFTF